MVVEEVVQGAVVDDVVVEVVVEDVSGVIQFRVEELGCKLELVPVFQDEAFAFVRKHHRHHGVPEGSVFQVAAAIDGVIVGVAVCGRPVGRGYQDGFTLEVTRMCTSGEKNACSFLYGACWRVCRNLGYRRLVTYVLSSESGGSVRAAGWKEIGKVRGRSWSCKSRPRVELQPGQHKISFGVSSEAISGIGIV